MTPWNPGRAGWLAHVAAVVIATVIFALIYDPFHASALAFLALTPVTLVFADPRIGCSFQRALVCGFAFGLLASMAIVGPWMFAASVDYFDRGSGWSFGFTLFVNALYVALFYAPAFAAIRLLSTTPPVVRIFGAASVWIALEAVRAAHPFGNSWALLGHGVAGIPIVREAAAFGGMGLLGWLAAVCGSAIGVALQPDLGTRDVMRSTRIVIAAPALLVILGVVAHYGDRAFAPLPPLRVAVVQAEIASRDVWDPAQRMSHWNRYIELTESLKPGTVDVVVWPESAAPFLLDSDATARARLVEISTKLNAGIVLGAPRTEDTGEGRADLYNSVYYFSPGVPEPKTYDKRRLLPFVERSPVDADGRETTEYAAGALPGMFDVRGWQLAPLVCFEAIYPEYSRAAVLAGAHVLLNLSNDAWFSGGAGPEQHFSMSMARSVEMRRAMVRVANGGVSGAVGPDGSEIGFTIRRQKAVRMFTIPTPPRTMTWAARHGDDFVTWIAGAIALASLVWSLRPVPRN